MSEIPPFWAFALLVAAPIIVIPICNIVVYFRQLIKNKWYY